MNKAQQMMIFLAQLIENDKDLDLVSDGIDGGLDFHFNDCSRINIKEVNDNVCSK